MWLALATLLTALPPAGKSIAVLDFETAGVSPELASAAGLLVPEEVRKAAPTAQVVSGNDIRTMISNERQKALLGCGSESSCLAELAGALGSEELVSGKLGRIGTSYIVELRRVDMVRGRPIHSVARTVAREDQLIETIKSGIADLYPAPKRGTPSAAWVPAAVGVAALGTGTYFLVQAKDAHDKFTARTPPASGETPAQLESRGNTQQLFGFIGLGVGVAAIAATGALYAFTGPADAPGDVQVAFTGNAVGVTLCLP